MFFETGILKKTFLFTLFITVLFVSARSRQKVLTGALRGGVVFSNKNGSLTALKNVVIKTDPETLVLHKDRVEFYLTGVSVGKNFLKISVHDPFLGNFVTNIKPVYISNYAVTALKPVVFRDRDRISSNPVKGDKPLNRKIVVDRFPEDGFDLSGLKRSEKFFFGEIFWQDLLLHWGDRIYNEYKAYDGSFIYIKGFVSPGEGNGDPHKRTELAYRRAFYIYRFIVNNFRLPEKNFIISTGDFSKLVKPHRLEAPENKRVEILFHSVHHF